MLLSIAVCFFYNPIVLGYWGYMIWVQESSNSWRNSAEIAASAIDSRPKQLLWNTVASIETAKKSKPRVRVVSVGGQVQLSFKEQPNEERIALNAWHS